MEKVDEQSSLLLDEAEKSNKTIPTPFRVYYYASVIALSSFIFGYIPCITNGAMVGDAQHGGANGV